MEEQLSTEYVQRYNTDRPAWRGSVINVDCHPSMTAAVPTPPGAMPTIHVFSSAGNAWSCAPMAAITLMVGSVSLHGGLLQRGCG
jgi:hypothetical protein